MDAELMKRLRFRPECDGAQDYDLVLRCVAEVLTEGGQTAGEEHSSYPQSVVSLEMPRGIHGSQSPQQKIRLRGGTSGSAGSCRTAGILRLPVRPGMWDFIVYSIPMYYRTARMWQP